VRDDVLPGLDAEVLLALRVERQHHAEGDLINSLTKTKKGKRKK
jgi:hypothetical protein